MRRRLGGLDLARARRSLAATAAAAANMGVGLWYWMQMTQGRSIWLVAGGGIVFGITIFWLLALLLRVPEASQLPHLILQRET